MSRQTTRAKKASRAKRPNRRTRNTPRDRTGDVVFTVVAVIVVFGSLLGIVVVQTFIVQNRVQLDAVNAELIDERERNQQLRLSVIELEAPKRIIDTASTRLGMVRPEERTYLPGIDPTLEIINPPPVGIDPFGPAPLSDELLPKDDEEADDDVAAETGEIADVEPSATNDEAGDP